MTTKSDTNILALAALFPAAFSAQPWRAHRPLKVGIGNDLVARGVLGAREVNAALNRYVDRLMYQKCLAAGGLRVDLDGNVAGEVSSEQRCRAERLVARFRRASWPKPRRPRQNPRAKRLARGQPCLLPYSTVRFSSCRRGQKRHR